MIPARVWPQPAILTVALLVLCGGAAAPPKNKVGPSDRAKQQVQRAEAERVRAILQSDEPSLAGLIADDCVVTTINGEVLDRKGDLALYGANGPKTLSWEPSEVAVRVYGNAAVVNGKATFKNVLDGQTRENEIRFTHVWVRQGERWQMVARHATRIDEAERQRAIAPAEPSAAGDSLAQNALADAPPAKSGAEQEIHAYRARMRQALLTGDLATLDAGWASDFIQVQSWGELRTKEQVLARMRESGATVLSLDTRDRRLRVYGDLAVETGQVSSRFRADGRVLGGSPARFTLILVHEKEGWVSISNQVSPITSAGQGTERVRG
jgi:ketosteroid isomerase-like protein